MFHWWLWHKEERANRQFTLIETEHRKTYIKTSSKIIQLVPGH